MDTKPDTVTKHTGTLASLTVVGSVRGLIGRDIEVVGTVGRGIADEMRANGPVGG